MPQVVSAFTEIEEEFIQRVHSMIYCSAATVDARQRPRSRVLHTIWEGATGWTATTRTSYKATHLARNPFMSLAYLAEPLKPVYVECRAAWDDDVATKQRIWDLFKYTAPPLGYDPAGSWGTVENPAFGVLRLEPWRIELYDLLQQHNRKIWRGEGAG